MTKTCGEITLKMTDISLGKLHFLFILGREILLKLYNLIWIMIALREIIFKKSFSLIYFVFSLSAF